MKKKIILILLILSWTMTGWTKDKTYKVTVLYEADDQGNVLTQKPYEGWITLKADGTYNIQLYFNDIGKYQFFKANSQQPNDTIYFNSSKNFQYFAYPRENMIALWLNKPRAGVNLWVNAYLTTDSAAQPSSNTPSQPSIPLTSNSVSLPGLIKNHRFTKTVMFSSTSAGSYFYYDESTGSFSHDQTGLIFWPNGTYYMKAYFGDTETVERGSYNINGRKIIIYFDDGSNFIFDIASNNKDLHYYSNGMLINEYFFLSAQ